MIDNILAAVYIASGVVVFTTAASILYDYIPRKASWKSHLFKLSMSVMGASAFAGVFQALMREDTPWGANVVLLAALATACIVRAPCNWFRWVLRGAPRE